MTGAWEPANDVEWAMARAAAGNDRREFFRLVATADLYLPQILAEPAGGGPADAQRFVTATLVGQTFLPVFTSVAGMAVQVRGFADGYTVTSYTELRRKWPDPRWRLAVNPGSPLEAYVPIEAVAAAAAGDLVVPTMAELVAEAADATAEEAPGAADEAPGGAGPGEVDRYVTELLDTVVLVPTAREVADPNEILEPGFPWRTAGTPGERSRSRDLAEVSTPPTAQCEHSRSRSSAEVSTPPAPPGEPTVEVFTSAEALAAAYPDPVPTVSVAMPFVLACWPQGHALSIDPGSPRAVHLPSDQVQWLLLWGQSDDTPPTDG